MKVSRLLLGIFVLNGLNGRAQTPLLTTLSPVRNTVAAPCTSPIGLTFSQPMSAATASGDAIKVFSSQRGGLLTRAGGGGIFSGAGTNAVSFQPAQPFLPGEVLTVVATPAATSAAGAALAVPQVYQFTAKAGAGPATFIADSAVSISGSPFDVKMGDVDGDGDLDLLTANPSFASVSVRLNDGTGHFGGGSEVTGTNHAMCLELADADGDGDLDLFTGNYGPFPPGTGDQVGVYRNDGTGAFTFLEQVPVLPGVYTLTLADIDGDGDVDILTPAITAPATPLPTTPRVAVRFNDGTGHFSTTGPDLITGYNVATLATGDIDSDGDLDLIVPGYDTARTVGVWRNSGAGIFSLADTMRVAGTFKVVLADMDGDGDLDLLNANNFSLFSLHRNDGTGTFGPATAVPLPGVQLNNLIVPDLDGDGDLDVVVTNVNLGTLSVLLNDGTGAFAGPSILPVGAFDYIVAAADVDGDFDLDLLTSLYNDNKVVVLLNGGTAVGVPAEADAPAVSLFPNPAHHTVRLTNASAGPVTVLDAVGRTVRVATIAPGQAEATLSVEGLTPGLYLVRAGQQTRRLVVE